MLESGVEAQSEWEVAESPPLESATEWEEEEAQRLVVASQFAPLEAATGLTAEAERLGEPEEESRCRERLRRVAFGKGVRWLVRNRSSQQSAFLRLRRRGRFET